jgi:hypothetical protein
MTLDDKIRELKEVVAKKESALGEKPKSVYKTNLKWSNTNILTLQLEGLVDLLSEVLYREEKNKEASKLLGLDDSHTSNLGDYKQDIILRGKILKYDQDKKELDAVKKKLDSLRSEELKRSDELEDLDKLLKG